jgi:hypothetical protein
MENAEIKKQIQELLDKGVTMPSTSPCGYPIVLVPKKDSTWHILLSPNIGSLPLNWGILD